MTYSSFIGHFLECSSNMFDKKEDKILEFSYVETIVFCELFS